MRASLKPFWFSLALLWLAGIAALRVYPWPVAPPPSAAAAFLIEFSCYLVLGFPSVLERLSRRSGGPAVPLLLVTSAVLPYVVYTLPAGLLDWRTLAALAFLAALLVFWFRLAPRNVATDLIFLGIVAAVALTRVFPALYPPAVPRFRADFLGQVMWRRLAILAILLYRGAPAVDLGFLPRRREWQAGFREYLFFIPIGVALGLGIGFVRFQPMAGDFWRIALVAAGTFLAMLWFVAFTEEFFFRGLLQHWASERLPGRWTGLLVASVVFGAAHLTFHYPPVNWRFAIVATAAGIFYGRAFQRGGVRAAMVTHALVNVSWKVLFV